MADLDFDALPLEQQQRIRGRVYGTVTTDLEGGAGSYLPNVGLDNDNGRRDLRATTPQGVTIKNVIRAINYAHTKADSSSNGVNAFETRISSVVGNEGYDDQEAFESIGSNLIQAVAVIKPEVTQLREEFGDITDVIEEIIPGAPEGTTLINIIQYLANEIVLLKEELENVSENIVVDINPTQINSLADTRPHIAADSLYLVPQYKVGNNSLKIYVQGLLCNEGIQYEEIGLTDSQSSQIKWLIEIPVYFDVVFQSFNSKN